MAQRAEQQLGEGLEGSSVLDLQDHADVGTAQSIDLRSDEVDVVDAADVRHGDQVGVWRDGLEGGDVGVGQRGNPQMGVGQVDPLLWLEPRPFGMNHGERDAVVPDLGHGCLDQPIVEQDTLALGDGVEQFVEVDVHVRVMHDRSDPPGGLASPGPRRSSSVVPEASSMEPSVGGRSAMVPRAMVRRFRTSFSFDTPDQVRRALGCSVDGGADSVGHNETPSSSAGVTDVDLVVRRGGIHEFAGSQLDDAIVRPGRMVGNEPDETGLDDLAEFVSFGFHLGHRHARPERSRPQLRTGKIEGHLDVAIVPSRRVPHVNGHAEPRGPCRHARNYPRRRTCRPRRARRRSSDRRPPRSAA